MLHTTISLNIKACGNLNVFSHFNTELVLYLDPHCSCKVGILFALIINRDFATASIAFWKPRLVLKKTARVQKCKIDIQRGSEYQPFEHQTFWSLDFKWSGIQVVGLCATSYVLEIDPQFEYQTSTYRNKMSSMCPVFK